MKITMYGAPICGDCVTRKEQLANIENLELDYHDITASTANMREFLKYRDQESLFDDIKREGRIGIPFFILEDGTKTLEIEKYVQLQEVERKSLISACSLDGKGNC